MSENSNKGGMFKGKSHEEGGIPIEVEETGQKIEVEGKEPLIPEEIGDDPNIYEMEGTNRQILNEILSKVGAKSLSEKATEVHAGDMIICVRSAHDTDKHKYKGTLKEIVSKVNESGGCNVIEEGGQQVYRYGGKTYSLKDGAEVVDKAKIKEEQDEIYGKWKKLVNMSYSELKKFYDSKEGKEAGLSSSEAKSQGIKSGRESARWIMKMKKTKREDWTPKMWEWANRQISFISRMSGMEGDLYKPDGRTKTRKHTSLLIWGHNPKKFAEGGVTENGALIGLPFHADIDKLTTENKNYRKIIYTNDKSQLSLMSLLPKEEIGEEVHDGDQFIRVESGEGIAIIEGMVYPLKKDVAIGVPEGYLHNIVNTSDKERLTLYTIYSPPQHEPDTLQKLKSDPEKELERKKAAEGMAVDVPVDDVRELESFKNWFGDSKVVDEDGNALPVYHGTTHEWSIYSPERGNPDNDLGIAFYATSDPMDATQNYHSTGIDLQHRIDNRVEQLENDEDMDREDALNQAMDELVGEDDITMEVFLKMENPVILSPEWSEGTVYHNETEEDEEMGFGESEFFQELHDAINGALYELKERYGIDPYSLTTDDVMATLGEHIPEIYYEDIKAYDIYKTLKTQFYSDDLYADGHNYNGEFIRLIFEELGHDGAILMYPADEFPNMGIGSDTKHYMVWNPTSIKYADGSNYTFDPNNPDIRYKEGGGLPYAISSSEEKLIDDAKHHVKTFEKTDEGQLFDRKVINHLKKKRNASKSARNKNMIQNLIKKLEIKYNKDYSEMAQGGTTNPSVAPKKRMKNMPEEPQIYDFNQVMEKQLGKRP